MSQLFSSQSIFAHLWIIFSLNICNFWYLEILDKIQWRVCKFNGLDLASQLKLFFLCRVVFIGLFIEIFFWQLFWRALLLSAWLPEMNRTTKLPTKSNRLVAELARYKFYSNNLFSHTVAWGTFSRDFASVSPTVLKNSNAASVIIFWHLKPIRLLSLRLTNVFPFSFPCSSHLGLSFYSKVHSLQGPEITRGRGLSYEGIFVYASER